MASEWHILMSIIAQRPIVINNLFEIFTISLLSTLSLWNCVTIQCVHFRLNRENIDAKRHIFIIAISRCFPSFNSIAYYTCTCNQAIKLITSLYEPLYDNLYKRCSYISLYEPLYDNLYKRCSYISLYEPLYDNLYKRCSYISLSSPFMTIYTNVAPIYISMLISNRLFITNEHSLNSIFWRITRCDESIESMLF